MCRIQPSSAHVVVALEVPRNSCSMPRKQFGPRKLHQSARGADGLKAVTFPADVTRPRTSLSPYRRPPRISSRSAFLIYLPTRLPSSVHLIPAICFESAFVIKSRNDNAKIKEEDASELFADDVYLWNFGWILRLSFGLVSYLFSYYLILYTICLRWMFFITCKFR